ncbi:MAG: transglutaminase [Actinobacteria bacterium 13_2_20CM_2_71_6]|nr:MAG: transglutaminase [Actinobacteria bacterium 13_2_20CM_2_71_6]
MADERRLAAAPTGSAAWRLRINHVSGFTYAGTAHASYNEARMTPMTTPYQITLFSQVDVAPAAAASTWRYLDYWGTQVTVFDLQRAHQQLKVTASSLVETERPSPPEPVGWDVLRSESILDRQAELLAASPRTTVDEGLLSRAAELAGGAQPRDAARAICDWVRDNVAYVPGSTGVQTGAQEAWELRKGVCQDIAHLTAALLRGVGIPARYVSGYLHPNPDAEIGETVEGQSHAWVEWWCGGWEGYDPTNGVETAERHVVVARGREYSDVTPLKGVYNGAPSSELGVRVEVTRLG